VDTTTFEHDVDASEYMLWRWRSRHPESMSATTDSTDDTEGVLPPLLLTGGPAVGKSSTAVRLVEPLRRAAVVDVDDLRHLVVAGHAAPWDGSEGRLQQHIGVENACDLARRYLQWSIEVVLSDVLDHETAALYRRLLPGVLILQLRVPLAEARRRATLRPVYLTDEEFEALHALQRDDVGADQLLDVGSLTLSEQVDAVSRIWTAGP
jgi:predicted kinase